MMRELKATLESYLERINALLSAEERQVLFKIIVKIVNELSRKDPAAEDREKDQFIRNIPIE